MKKILKLIYKLKMKGKSIRTIKRELFVIYKLNIKEKLIANIVRNIKYTKNKYSETEMKKILYLYSNFFDADYLVKYFNEKYGYDLTYNRLVDLASRNGVKKNSKNMYKQSYISRDDELKIVELYKSGLSATEIAKRYEYKRKESIYSKLEKFNVKRQNWNDEQSLKKSYFEFSLERIDTEFKAYFLGLMLTDRYINEERKYIELELIDEDCIAFLAKKIGVKYKVIDKKNKNLQLRYRITLYGEKYINEVKRLALVKRKTFSNKTPLLKEEELMFASYILRGAIDGDGWIRKDGLEFFLCSASKEMIYWYKNIMEKIGFIDLKVTFIKNKWNGIYQIRTGIKYNLYILKNRIYNKKIGMMRKYKLLL